MTEAEPMSEVRCLVCGGRDDELRKICPRCNGVGWEFNPPPDWLVRIVGAISRESDSPFNSDRLCRCGHKERHHVAARDACPVVVFDSEPPRRCACPRFQDADTAS